MKANKPLGIKSYGTIPHLIGSRVTPEDHHCSEGQSIIATIKPRDRHDDIIVTEKLDGSNVGIALFNNEILAITRAGYLAETSPFIQHHYFAKWVKLNESRFRYVLNNGERLCGEWLAQAHGTIYTLPHEPIVFFDLMNDHDRLPYDLFLSRISKGSFITPHLIHRGYPMSIESMLMTLSKNGFHGADYAEGAVWKIERRGKFDFNCKYVRPDKIDGIYLPEKSGSNEIWNWSPNNGGGE